MTTRGTIIVAVRQSLDMDLYSAEVEPALLRMLSNTRLVCVFTGEGHSLASWAPIARGKFKGSVYRDEAGTPEDWVYAVPRKPVRPMPTEMVGRARSIKAFCAHLDAVGITHNDDTTGKPNEIVGLIPGRLSWRDEK